MTNNKPTTINFETALQELNTLVEEMEQGDLALEESLKRFKKGITLIHKCQTELKKAEQKVQILMARDKLEPYETKE